MIKDFNGNKYDSMEDYYNSPELDDDLIYNYLAKGLRTPQNEKEERWKREGESIIQDGFYEMYFE